METITKERACADNERAHSVERLRTAIKESLIREELVHDVEEILREFDSVKIQNQILSNHLKTKTNELKRYKGIFLEAIRLQKEAEARRAKLGVAASCAIAAGTLFVIILACMLICRAIFG